MSVVWHFERPKLPLRALVLSFSALLVPVAQTLFLGEPTPEQPDALLWLLALVPAFLLAYYRGWRGAATALAIGMVVLVASHLVAVMLGSPPASWSLLLGVTLAYTLVALAAGWGSERLHAERARAERLALTDDLTGLWNRRRARMALESAFEGVARGQPLVLAVVMFDLDKFKSYNDLNGHGQGDELLRLFGRTLLANTASPHLSSRYGGEEFVSVLSYCDEAGALAFAERVRAEFRGVQTLTPALTTCAGIAVYRPGMTSPNDLLIAADQALYQAKQGGRDCVRIYSAPGATKQAG